MNTVKFYNTEDEYYHVIVKHRKNGGLKFKIYVPDGCYQNKIRNITTAIRIRDILRSYEWTKMSFINTDGKTFTRNDVLNLIC